MLTLAILNVFTGMLGSIPTMLLSLIGAGGETASIPMPGPVPIIW